MLCRYRHNQHLIRNTFRLASQRDRDALRRDVKPIYTAVNAEAARAALDGLAETWGQRYPAIIRLWENAWAEFIPFLDYDVEIRKVLCSTNAIVISSPNLGVFVVNAVGVLCAFSYVVDALPAQCLRRRPGADLLVGSYSAGVDGGW